MVSANYKVFVNWDGRDEFINDFEEGTGGWETDGGLTTTIELSTEQAFSGEQSLKIVWPAYNPFTFDSASRGFGAGRFGPDSASGSTLEESYVYKVLANLNIGDTYQVDLKCYVPSGSYDVTLALPSVTTDTSTLNDEWEELSIEFTATDTEHTIHVYPSSDPVNGGTAYLDYVQVIRDSDNMTDMVLDNRTPLKITRGRDSIRSSTAITPGELTMEVLNTSRDYSPNNPDSPIFGSLTPGKEINVSAEFGGRGYRLFRGYLYDYEILPVISSRSVKFSAQDMMQKMESFQLSTPLYPSLRTGEAINLILDEMDWPDDKRDVDTGATTVRWWYEDDVSALDALEKLTYSEGLGSFSYVTPEGVFVFRDRHHRYLRDRSLTVQATLDGSEGGSEPQVSDPFTYNIGWRELYNTVSVTVDEVVPEVQDVVWERSRDIVLTSGETETLDIVFDDPVTNARTPEEDVDYNLSLGSVNISLSRNSGKSLRMDITAVGGPAKITSLQLRANPVVTDQTYSVDKSNNSSIDIYGEQTYTQDMPWASYRDTIALADIVLGNRAEQLPAITATLNNHNTERMTELLQREVSDRVHIIESETFTDDDFYVNQIEHTITEGGLYHTALFGYEQVKSQVDNVFTFDDPDKGFNDGVFGISGVSNPSDLFIVGTTNLGEGFLGY